MENYYPFNLYHLNIQETRKTLKSYQTLEYEVKIGENILRIIAVIAVTWSVWQNVNSLTQTHKFDARLNAHLSRLRKENDLFEKYCFNGARIEHLNCYDEELFLTRDHFLKAEYLVKVDTNQIVIHQLKQEHERELLLEPVFKALFTTTSDFITLDLIAKSIIDKKIYVGTIKDPHFSGKYDVFINQIPLNYSDEGEYVVFCSDTFNLQINAIRMKRKTGELDTIVMKEVYIPNSKNDE